MGIEMIRDEQLTKALSEVQVADQRAKAAAVGDSNDDEIDMLNDLVSALEVAVELLLQIVGLTAPWQEEENDDETETEADPVDQVEG